MPVAPARIVGISARNEEAVMVAAGGVTFIVLAKAHTGGPRRELEVFTLPAAINAGVGPYYFNLRPLRVEVLKQDFFLVSMQPTTASVARFYWNPVTLALARDVKVLEIDLSQGLAPSGVVVPTVTGFPGIDPFIMDARTVDAPSRLYLVYGSAAGDNAYRISDDFGATWNPEVIFDPQPGEPPIRQNECNFNDPLGARDDVQVLTQRDNG